MFNLSVDSDINKTGQYLNSFVTNNKGVSTIKSSQSHGMSDSMAYSVTYKSIAKEDSKMSPLEVIHSESGDSGSNMTPKSRPDITNQDVNSEEEDLDRFEEIDIQAISIGSSQKSPDKKMRKALLSKSEIEQAHKQRENDSSQNNEDFSGAKYVLQCKNLIESGKFNAEDFKSGNKSLFKSIDILNKTSKFEFNSYIESEMLKFHPNFDFEIMEMVDMDMPKHSLGLVQYYSSEVPTHEEVYYFTKYVVHSSQMEKEIPLMALIYIERLLTKLGILMNHWNWKRLILITLIVASKVWDDESLENVHFPQAMPDLSIKEVNGLEKIFVELISYELIIKPSDYAKYYFILRSLADKDQESECEYDFQPMEYIDLLNLSMKSDKAEETFRNILNKT